MKATDNNTNDEILRYPSIVISSYGYKNHKVMQL